MSRPPAPRNFSPQSSNVRVNGKIRAREVRVIGTDNTQLGVFPLNEALARARAEGVDLVEIAATASPPVCRLVDYGKYRYEISKKDKESKKHQHANRVKEIQLSPQVATHDFGVKLTHAIDFLCEDMKVKVTLKFRGREMAHQEYGFQTVHKFVKELLPFATPDNQPKLIGRGINVMLTPLPRNKRAKNPNQAPAPVTVEEASAPPHESQPEPLSGVSASEPAASGPDDESSQFANNPFAKLDVNLNG